MSAQRKSDLAYYYLFAALLLPQLLGCASPNGQRISPRPEKVVETLNALRNDLSAHYGFRDGAPRVNLGPCGRIARDFRERWNARFSEPVAIAFIMSGDGKQCYHVLVRLADKRFFDGGNGVVTAAFLATLYPDSKIDVMENFNFVTLDQRSYGLARDYPECQNYSDEFTCDLIERHLKKLATFGGTP